MLTLCQELYPQDTPGDKQIFLLLKWGNQGPERGSTLPKVPKLKVAGTGPELGLLQLLCGTGPSQAPCLAWLPLCLQVLPDKL